MKAGDRFRIEDEGETWEIVQLSVNGGPFIARVEIDAGKGPPRHAHVHEEEVMDVTRGTVTFFLPEGKRELHAGDRLVIPAGTSHTFRAGPAGFAATSTYSGGRFEALVRQLHPGDKKGFIRMAQVLVRTDFVGSRLTSPLIRGLLTLVAFAGRLLGVRPTGDADGSSTARTG